MDDGHVAQAADARLRTKTKVIGRLFGGRKSTKTKDDERPTNDNDVSDFLRGSSDQLLMTGVPPEQAVPRTSVSKPFTPAQPQWPTNETIRSVAQELPIRQPKKSKKGTNVSFSNQRPEVIGFGGDEFEEPTYLVSRAKEEARSRAHAPGSQAQIQKSPSVQSQDFRPNALQRIQTGFGNAQAAHMKGPVDASESEPIPPLPHLIPAGQYPSRRHDDEDITARIKMEMRASEGRALANARAAAQQQQNPSDSYESFHSIESMQNSVASLSRTDTRSSAQQNGHLVPVFPQPHPPSPRHQQSIYTYGHGNHYGGPGDVEHAGVNNRPRKSSNASSIAASIAPSIAPSMAQSVAPSMLNEQALEDFASRVQNSYKLFALSAESFRPLYTTPLSDLVRAASWWFLRGRTNVEIAARERGQAGQQNGAQSRGLLKEQGHADLAKSLWLTTTVIPQCPELSNSPDRHRTNSRDFDLDDLVDRCEALHSHLMKLTSSMSRNNFLPPTIEEAPLSAGIDNSVWLPALPVPRDVSYLLSTIQSGNGASSHTPVSVAIPIGDTANLFNYSRSFVYMYLLEEGNQTHQDPIRCLMSASRHSDSTELSLYISNLSGEIDIHVQSDDTEGPTWYDVRWQGDIPAIDLRLPRGFVARIRMQAHEFDSLWNLYEHMNTVQPSLHPDEHENVIFDTVLASFMYFDDDPKITRKFPREAVVDCHMRLFEKTSPIVAGTGTRRRHRGFRIGVMTGVKTKHQDSLNYDVSLGQAIRYEFLRGPTGGPSFSLTFSPYLGSNVKARLTMNFVNDADRSKFRHLLIAGANVDEATFCKAPVASFSTSSLDGQEIGGPLHNFFAWSSVRVVNRGIDGSTDCESTKIALSDNLRILVESQFGVITDRINVEMGHVRLALAWIQNEYQMTVYREAQNDLSFSLQDSQVPRETLQAIATYIDALNKKPTLRIFRFRDLAAQQTFQSAITGFSILFDDVAPSFTIARRRMVVPIYKKWDCPITRIQVLRREKLIQLVAFFEGWSHGRAMNFALKSTDDYEALERKSSSGGRWLVRMVDQKFALPLGAEDDKAAKGGGFVGWTEGVSLDEPEYPGEHDDVTIAFESQSQRESFAAVLPAPVKNLGK